MIPLSVLLGLAWLGWLVWFLERRDRRRRLLNPDYAFPSLSPSDPPHTFQPSEGLPICGLCGGGKLHIVHCGGPWPPPGGFKRRPAGAFDSIKSSDTL